MAKKLKINKAKCTPTDMSKNSELVKCIGSIRAIEGAMIIFLIASILIIVSFIEYMSCTKENGAGADISVDTNKEISTKCIKDMEINNKLIAGFVMIFISFIVLVVAALNAAYYGCFRTAIASTFLAFLLII